MGPNDPSDTPAPLSDDKEPAEALTPKAWLVQNGTILAFALVGLAIVLRYYNPVAVLLAAIGLGLMIFIHELGHFAAAKWCDVHVETFSIGFGPALPGCRWRYGETTYKLAVVPLGGFVNMVGEGTDSEEGEDDPRSFKNKTVPQRMLIISAGVIMNMILAGACFVFVFMTHGVEESPAVVLSVSPGSTAWQKGIRAGDEIVQIGDTQKPFFNDIRMAILRSSRGEVLPVRVERFQAGRPVEPPPPPVFLEPRREDDNNPLPVIGVMPPLLKGKLVLLRRGFGKPPVPYLPDSAASKASSPGFEVGDRIVATTDPDQLRSGGPYDPNKLLELPPDPRVPADTVPKGEGPPRDFFEYERRMRMLAGKPVVLAVRRAGTSDTAPEIRVEVPPAYAYTFPSVHLGIGEVVGIRDDSPAAKAGVRARDPKDPASKGDILSAVEVTKADGTKLRFVTGTPTAKTKEVEERQLDPVRLPFDLQEWADGKPTDRQVRLTVLREKDHKDRTPVDDLPPLTWDDSRRYDDEQSITPSAPQAIASLGLAYRVQAEVEAVDPESEAGKAGLQSRDAIKEVQFQYRTEKGEVKAASWVKVKVDQAAFILPSLQMMDIHELKVKVERPSAPGTLQTLTLKAEPDRTWPWAERGLLFEPEIRLQKADGVLQALEMGARQELRTADMITQNLKAMATGRISLWSLSGPLAIAERSYSIADESLYRLIFWLGMLNVNLAIVNFLPIPVLDGGHMLFLLYEGVRGKPPAEAVRVWLTFAGLAVICSLMLFVVFLDVQRYFF